MTFPSSMFGTLVSLGAQIVGARREQKRRSNASIARNNELQRAGVRAAQREARIVALETRAALLAVENAKLRNQLDGFTRPYVGGVTS